MVGASYPVDLFKVAEAVLQNSYSPYSNYKVACALRTSDGSVFSGCNVENASYGLTQCAEASAIGSMVSSVGLVKIVEILILVAAAEPASPCGACRQRLVEFANPDAKIHMCSVSGSYNVSDMQSLLPLSFSL